MPATQDRKDSLNTGEAAEMGIAAIAIIFLKYATLIS